MTEMDMRNGDIPGFWVDAQKAADSGMEVCKQLLCGGGLQRASENTQSVQANGLSSLSDMWKGKTEGKEKFDSEAELREVGSFSSEQTAAQR